jgi:hypothetical protein
MMIRFMTEVGVVHVLQEGQAISLMAVDEPEDERQDHARNETGHQWKIEGEVLPPVEEVAGEPPEPGDLSGEDHDEADPRDDQTDHDENFTQIGKVEHNQTP